MTPDSAPVPTAVDTVHVFFCTHLDIGYTDTQARIEWKMKEHLDDALRLCREHDDFRYTIETAWTLGKWLERTDDPELRREMADRIREGRMELCAAFATQHGPICGPEDLNQLCYDARHLADELGVDFVSAMQNDVPGYPWAYPQILRKSGVRYLLTGINTILGGGFPLPPTHNPFYWEGVDGSRVLTMVQDGYCHYIYRWTHFRSFMNGEDLGAIEEGVKAYLGSLAEGGNPYTVVGMIANPCDNRGPLESMAMLQRMREWNASGRLPKFVTSTPRAYFDDLIARHGDSFPVMRGDWDPTWAWNCVKTRGPVGSVGARLAQGRLPMAEKLHAVAAMARGMRFPAPEFRGAWDALIHYDEHSAPEGPGDHRRCTRREILLANRRHYEWAMRAFNDGEMLLELGVVELARGVRTPDYDTVAVFNPSAWPRTALVRAATGGAEYESFPEPRRLKSLVDLETGETVPCDNDTMSELGGDGRGPDALPCAAFVAKDIPPMGYRLYRAVHDQQDGEAVPRQSVVTPGSARIENGRFRVEVDGVTGAITSIFDKELGYELSASGAVGFPSIDSAAAIATPVSVTSTVGRTFQRIEIHRPGSWFPETDIRVSEGAGHVEIRNVFDRTAWRAQNPDAPTWSVDTRFALALPADARVTASGPNGFRRDRGDALPFIEERSLPSCSFIAADDGERCVVIASPTDYLFSAPLRGEGGIVLRTHTIAQGFGPIGLRQVAPQMMPSLEPGEEGIVVHRYALTSHAGPFDPVRAQRLGVEFRAEMPAVFAPAVHAAPERPYPMPPEQGPPTRSFVRLEDPAGEACADVAVLRRSLFPAGNFFVMRLQELAGDEARTVRVRFDPSLQITGAAMADMLERRGDNLPLDPDGGISVRIGPFETVTLALDTAELPRA